MIRPVRIHSKIIKFGYIMVDKVLFNVPLRFLIESYLEFALCSQINIFKIQTTITGDIAGMIISLGLIVITYSTPLLVFMLIKTYYKRSMTVNSLS